MNFFTKKRTLGFTIMELLIVLIIIAILVALAYPSYIQYVRKSKRGEAQQLLMNWSINQEIWRSNHTSYAADDAVNGIAAPTDDNYNFTIPVRTASTYTLTATAKVGNDQENDIFKGNDCSTLTLNQSGVKDPPGCWE